MENPYKSPVETGACQSAERSSLQSRLLHLGLLIAAPAIAHVIHLLLFSETLPVGDPYSIYAPELLMLTFGIGFYFSRRSKFPCLGWIGLPIGHLLACILFGLFSPLWMIVGAFASLVMSVIPFTAECIGMLVGRAIFRTADDYPVAG